MTKFCEHAVVAGNRQIAPGHYLLALECPSIAEAAKPGQFALLRSPLPGMPLLSRPFSIYGADAQKGQVEFLIKVVGRATELLCSQQPGSEMLVVGPLGRPFEEPQGKEVLLIGGGTGVAPLAFLAQRMAGKMLMHAIIGAPSAEYVLARDRFLEAGIGLTIVTEDGSEGETGLPTEVLAKMLSGGRGESVIRPRSGRGSVSPLHFSALACGPTAMLADVARICREAEVGCQVSLENQLGCGIGACYGCVVPAFGEDGASGWARVCAEGPVFPAEQIDWNRLQPQSSTD